MDKSTLDSNLDFFSNLDSETNVAILISDDNNCLEAGSLTGFSLLLDRYDLHDLIRKWLVLEELVNNLGLLDWDGVSINLFEGCDHAVLDESAKLGLWNPLILGGASTGTTITTTATTATTTASSSETTSFASLTTFYATFLSWSGIFCLCAFNHCKSKLLFNNNLKSYTTFN